MKHTIDYTNSLAPAFDAVEDIRNWLGEDKYNELYPKLAEMDNCAVFALCCSFVGIQGFPVKAWYEVMHGQGSWNQEQVDQAF